MTPKAQDSDILTAPRLDTIAPYEETIDLWGVLLVLGSNWRWIAGLTMAGLIAGVVISMVLKPTFTAEAIILPPQQSTSSVSSLMGQIGMMTGLSGASAFGLKSPADMYIGILESRTIADNLISRFQLKDLYRTKTLVDARVALQRHVKFESGKDSLIHISVKDRDPNRASEIANGYVDELYKMNSQLATSEAGQRRSFYDQRLTGEKEALARAELDLKKTQQKTGLIQLSGQAASIIDSIAQARAQVASREVELQSIRTYATQENPDVVRLEEEIAAQRSNLASLENNQRAIQPGDIQVPTGQLPEAALEYERQTRELKYHATLYDLLSRQSEAARLDEAKSAPIIQVVDPAIPPDKKSGPSRKLITVGFTLFGFISACLWSLARAALRRMKSDPERAQKLKDLKSAFFS
jgi:tyrosine-protein kinase Etk/Wzc